MGTKIDSAKLNNFSPNRYGENSWGEIMEPFIDTSSQVKYGLDDGAIKRAIDGYDVVTTEVKDLRDFPGDANTPLMQYEAAAKLNIDDLYHVFAILEDMHPDYAKDIIWYVRIFQSTNAVYLGKRTIIIIRHICKKFSFCLFTQRFCIYKKQYSVYFRIFQ